MSQVATGRFHFGRTLSWMLHNAVTSEEVMPCGCESLNDRIATSVECLFRVSQPLTITYQWHMQWRIHGLVVVVPCPGPAPLNPAGGLGCAVSSPCSPSRARSPNAFLCILCPQIAFDCNILPNTVLSKADWLYFHRPKSAVCQWGCLPSPHPLICQCLYDLTQWNLFLTVYTIWSSLSTW